MFFLCLPEWGTPVPVGSPVFPGWEQHTYSCLSSFAGDDLVRNRNSVNGKRRHLVVEEATFINKWSNGGSWSVCLSVCQYRVEITISTFLPLLGCKLAGSGRACVSGAGLLQTSHSGWRWIIWVISDVYITPLKTCLHRIICNYRDKKLLISKTQMCVQMYGNVL